jgi:hypothetical protein
LTPAAASGILLNVRVVTGHQGSGVGLRPPRHSFLLETMMRTRWTLPAIMLGTMAGFSACAKGEVSFQTSSTGGPGTGGAHTGGMTASASSVASSTSAGGSGTGGAGGAGGSATASSSSGMTLCGNGVRDPGEQCDGSDFGPLTCQLLGFASGQLVCNSFCAVVATTCQPKENCSNAQDDNQNGLIDCQDPDCTNAPTCLDSCTPPTSATVPGFVFGDTSGRPAIHKSSCSAMSGPETIYEVVSPVDGTMTLSLSNFSGADYTLSVRTACGDDTTEIACANKEGAGSFNPEVLSINVAAGTTYFVMVDGNNPSDFGQFDLDLEIPLPESDCFNYFDDDGDGYVDCDDATDCQTLPDCMPSATAVGAGQPCFFPSDCQANHNDPVCLSDGQGFPGGYCSEFCDVAAQDCAPNAICWSGLNLSIHGVCLETCAVDTDCAPNFACVDNGLAKKVCMVGPESNCTDYQDNDADGLIDCQDPDKCQTLPACVPGAKAAGQPCTANTDCFANANDPICLDEMNLGFIGGYCSQFCNPAPDDCGAAGICAAEGPNGTNVCMQTCTTSAQCRVGYSCLDFGYPKKICF